MSERKRAARLAAAVQRAEAEALLRWPDNGNRNYDSRMKARRFAFVAGALWYRADAAHRALFAEYERLTAPTIPYETEEGVVVAVDLDGTVHRMKPTPTDARSSVANRGSWDAKEAQS